MATQMDMFSGGGSEVNKVKIGGTTVLHGDPEIKPEKPHTIILFPGGAVEVARTTDGLYWVHVSTRELPDIPRGRFVHARMDHDGRYNDEGNAALKAAVLANDVNHIAFLVNPARQTTDREDGK